MTRTLLFASIGELLCFDIVDMKWPRRFSSSTHPKVLTVFTLD
jgi:hypothetical protein